MTSLWTSLINHRDIRAGGSNRAVTIRDASDNTDPRLTRRARTAIQGIFGK